MLILKRSNFGNCWGASVSNRSASKSLDLPKIGHLILTKGVPYDILVTLYGSEKKRALSITHSDH